MKNSYGTLVAKIIYFTNSALQNTINFLKRKNITSSKRSYSNYLKHFEIQKLNLQKIWNTVFLVQNFLIMQNFGHNEFCNIEFSHRVPYTQHFDPNPLFYRKYDTEFLSRFRVSNSCQKTYDFKRYYLNSFISI